MLPTDLDMLTAGLEAIVRVIDTYKSAQIVLDGYLVQDLPIEQAQYFPAFDQFE